jgi:phosphoribosylanthranilate isomerase
MTRIKICGITNLKDALKAIELGADALGFIFAESPRQIHSRKVKEIIASLPPFITKVGVFVRESISTINILTDACRLDIIQLHGEYNLKNNNSFYAPIIRTVRVKDNSAIEEIKNLDSPYFLLDTYSKDKMGGTGLSFDWDIAREAKKHGKVILSGGLNHKNIRQALEAVEPYAVDVGSGVEREPGLKDFGKMKEFIDEVRRWDCQIN